jgi:hypothetical protein
MTFTCPHLRPDDEWCLLLRTDCVCGRPGCVMRATSVFLVPVEERIRRAAAAFEERERARLLAGVSSPKAPDRR